MAQSMGSGLQGQCKQIWPLVWPVFLVDARETDTGSKKTQFEH